MKQQRERQKLQQDQERALQEMRQSCQERSHMLETKLQHQKQEQKGAIVLFWLMRTMSRYRRNAASTRSNTCNKAGWEHHQRQMQISCG